MMQLMVEKMMTKPRSCPHCSVSFSLDREFYFDDQLNLMCSHCKRVVFPTSIEVEEATFSSNLSLTHEMPQRK